MKRFIAAGCVSVVALGWLTGGGHSIEPGSGARLVAVAAPARAVSGRFASPRIPGAGTFTIIGFAPVGAHDAWAVTEANVVTTPHQAVLRTADGGARWRLVTPGGLGRATLARQISSIAVDRSRQAWLSYGAGSRPQTLLTSTNGGRDWRTLGSVPRYCALQFVNSRDGWCTAINGALGSEFVTIYRTRTGGRRWQRVEVTAPPGQHHTRHAIPFGCDKTVRFLTPQLGFASSFCNGGGGFIDVTRDGGARWRLSLSIPRTPAEGEAGITEVVGGTHAAAAYTVYGPGGPSAIVVYVSDNAGQSWRMVQPPGPARPYVAALASPRAWRLVAGRTVLETDNAGRSWHTVLADRSLATSDQITFTTRTTAWSVPAGGVGRVLRTSDAGARWTVIHVP